jgi:hypothetical protein
MHLTMTATRHVVTAGVVAMTNLFFSTDALCSLTSTSIKSGHLVYGFSFRVGKYVASSNIFAPLIATRDVSLALSLIYSIDILIVSVADRMQTCV